MKINTRPVTSTHLYFSVRRSSKWAAKKTEKWELNMFLLTFEVSPVTKPTTMTQLQFLFYFSPHTQKKREKEDVQQSTS